jgi:GNAT superfamily N-acetyltransferase
MRPIVQRPTAQRRGWTRGRRQEDDDAVATTERPEGHPTVIVRTPALDRRTLERFYRGVLRPSFAPAELLSLDEACGEYLGDNAQPAALLLVGDEPVAGILAEVYPASGVLLVAYLAVHTSQRGVGVGTALFRETVPGWQASLRPALILAEIDDPRFHQADTGRGDPVARARFYARTGARMLAMPYVQPSLRDGSPRVRDMLLISYGTLGGSVPAEVVISFLNDYYSICESPAVHSDPEFQALLRWAAGDGERIPLWPLDRYADVPRFVPFPLSAPTAPSNRKGDNDGRRAVPHQGS